MDQVNLNFARGEIRMSSLNRSYFYKSEKENFLNVENANSEANESLINNL